MPTRFRWSVHSPTTNTPTAAKLKLIPTIAMTYNIKILLDPSRLLRVTEGP